MPAPSLSMFASWLSSSRPSMVQDAISWVCALLLGGASLGAADPLLGTAPQAPWQVDGLTLACDEFSGTGSVVQGLLAEDVHGGGWQTPNATVQPRRENGYLVSGGAQGVGCLQLPPMSPHGEITMSATVVLRGTSSRLAWGLTDGVHGFSTGACGPLLQVAGNGRLQLLQNATTVIQEVIIPARLINNGVITLSMRYAVEDRVVSVSAGGTTLLTGTLAAVSSAPYRYVALQYEDAVALNMPAMDALRIDYVPVARPAVMVPNRTITVTDTSLAGITKAIQDANAQSGPANIITVSIPKGNYTFTPPSGFTGGQIFLILGLKYLVIDWNGSTITMTDTKRGLFSLSHGDHVTVKNIASIDYADEGLPFTQGTVKSYNRSLKSFELEIDAGFPLPSNAFFTNAANSGGNWGQLIDSNRPGRRADGAAQEYWIKSVELVAGRVFRYTMNTDLYGFSVGGRFAHCPRAGNEIIRIFDAQNMRLENITGYSGPNFWSMIYQSNVAYHHVRILVKPGRLMSTNGDGATGNGNQLWMEYCAFEGLGDDVCNQFKGVSTFITDCIFQNTRRFGVWLNGANYAVIKDSVFDGVGSYPISGMGDSEKTSELTYATKNIICCGNIIKNSRDDAVHLVNFFTLSSPSPDWNSYWRLLRNDMTSSMSIRNATDVRCVGNTNGQGLPAAMTVEAASTRQVVTKDSAPLVPTIAEIAPATGPISGGNAVEIRGSGLLDQSFFVDGQRLYPDATRPRTHERCSLVMPAHAAGRVAVTVMTMLGASVSAANGYLYGDAPTITTPPQSQEVRAGETVTFSVVATSKTPMTYQWTKDGVALSGATSATYTMASTTGSDTGSYRVIVSNSASSVTSSAATLTVLTVPVIVEQPTDIAVNEGATARFSVRLTGNPTPTVQWYRDNEPVTGATTTELVLAAVTGADNGRRYRVEATNRAGSVTSATVTLTVRLKPVAQAPRITLEEDVPATITMTAMGGSVTSCVVTRNPLHGTVTAKGAVLTYVPSPDYHGTDTFLVAVVGADGLMSLPVQADLTITPVNDAPRPTNLVLGDLRGTCGTPVSSAINMGILFQDVDGDAMTYAITGLPEGLSYDAAGKKIFGTPVVAGTSVATITAADSSQATAQRTFRVIIGAASSPVDVGGSQPVDASPSKGGCGLGSCGIMSLVGLGLLAMRRKP